MPYIPFKSNCTGDSRTGRQDPMWKWFFHYYMANREHHMEHYH